jgi:hypothetical protein
LKISTLQMLNLLTFRPLPQLAENHQLTFRLSLNKNSQKMRTLSANVARLKRGAGLPVMPEAGESAREYNVERSAPGGVLKRGAPVPPWAVWMPLPVVV